MNRRRRSVDHPHSVDAWLRNCSLDVEAFWRSVPLPACLPAQSRSFKHRIGAQAERLRQGERRLSVQFLSEEVVLFSDTVAPQRSEASVHRFFLSCSLDRIRLVPKSVRRSRFRIASYVVTLLVSFSFSEACTSLSP